MGSIPGEGNGQLAPVFLPEESHAQRSLAGYTVRGVTKSQPRSDTSEQMPHTHCPLECDSLTSPWPMECPLPAPTEVSGAFPVGSQRAPVSGEEQAPNHLHSYHVGFRSHLPLVGLPWTNPPTTGFLQFPGRAWKGGQFPGAPSKLYNLPAQHSIWLPAHALSGATGSLSRPSPGRTGLHFPTHCKRCLCL